MIVRLYLDEDAMDTALVLALRARGADVIAANEVGMIEKPDEEHLAYATARERVLYSFNKGDYYSLHTRLVTQGISHAGIVLADHRRYSVGEQMRRLLKLIATRSAEEMQNRIEFLSAWSCGTLYEAGVRLYIQGEVVLQRLCVAVIPNGGYHGSVVGT